MKVFVLLSLLITPFGFAEEDLDSKYGHLVFASVVFRHGDRTPNSIYPTDPYNETMWPEGIGQLTNRGKWQEYQLGLWYRQRYDKLLGETYHKDKIYMMSSERDRTMMSAECFLAGLYPPSESEIWNPYLNWQPIPVHSITARIDHMIRSTEDECDMVDFQLQMLTNIPFYKKLYKDNEELFSYVSKYSGKEFSEDDIYGSIRDLQYIHDTLVIEDSYNFTLPDWTKPIYPEKLENLAGWKFVAEYYNLELQRLGAGPLIDMILRNMTDKRDGILDPDRSLVFYSGHDTNIAALLSVFGVMKPHSPTYSSSIIIELRKKNQDYLVVMFHKPNLTATADLIEMSKCPIPCTLENFLDVMVTEYIPDNWQEECIVKSTQNLSAISIISLTVFGLCLIGIVSVGLYLLNMYCLHNARARYSGYQKIAV